MKSGSNSNRHSCLLAHDLCSLCCRHCGTPFHEETCALRGYFLLEESTKNVETAVTWSFSPEILAFSCQLGVNFKIINNVRLGILAIARESFHLHFEARLNRMLKFCLKAESLNWSLPVLTSHIHSRPLMYLHIVSTIFPPAVLSSIVR